MKYLKILGPIVIFVAFVLLHKSIENNVFSMGFSWTLSAIIPYILQFIAGLLIALQFSQLLRAKSRLIQRLVGVLALLATCGIAFAINPIYEGDFANTKSDVVVNVNGETIVKEGLTMVALPGCPYCYGRIGTLNFLKDRNPDLNIEVMLVKEDSLTIANYTKRLLPSIKITATEHGLAVSQVIKGSYPAFLFRTKEGVVKYWKQQDFGTGAQDWIEDNH